MKELTNLNFKVKDSIQTARINKDFSKSNINEVQDELLQNKIVRGTLKKLAME